MRRSALIAERHATVRSYAAELMADPSVDFSALAPDVGGYDLPEHGAIRNGQTIRVRALRGMRSPGRVEIVVEESHGPVHRVVKDGFVAWDDGRRTVPDDQWEAFTS